MCVFVCSRNYLQDLPSEICSMNLHCINLSNNRLIQLPDDIGKLNKVQYLVSWSQTISSISTHFPSLFSSSYIFPSITHHLTSHSFFLFPIPFLVLPPPPPSSTPSPACQDLSCNMLPELPESFFLLSDLRHLSLHRNCIRDLSDSESLLCTGRTL